jgi:hypothetical protein
MSSVNSLCMRVAAAFFVDAFERDGFQLRDLVRVVRLTDKIAARTRILDFTSRSNSGRNTLFVAVRP